MSSICECPICMDPIEGIKNCVTTECGHAFHASCLMTSVAHNGFGCPYCRTAMADVPEEEDDESVYESDDDEEEEDEMFSDYALLGFRLFQSNISGEGLNPDDIEEEQDFLEGDEEEDVPVPSSVFITQKLIEQGFTMEKLVQSILGGCHEEYQNNDEYSRVDDDLYGKMRIIISNYSPEQQVVNHIVNPVQQVLELDHSAQPKTTLRPSILSRIMMHV